MEPTEQRTNHNERGNDSFLAFLSIHLSVYLTWLHLNFYFFFFSFLYFSFSFLSLLSFSCFFCSGNNNIVFLSLFSLSTTTTLCLIFPQSIMFRRDDLMTFSSFLSTFTKVGIIVVIIIQQELIHLCIYALFLWYNNSNSTHLQHVLHFYFHSFSTTPYFFILLQSIHNFPLNLRRQCCCSPFFILPSFLWRNHHHHGHQCGWFY